MPLNAPDDFISASNVDGPQQQRPRVSVLVAVFNGQRYLKEAIQSILAQRFEDFELIIVDDGSTDRSPRLLQQFLIGDKRIRVILPPHTGMTRLLN
jgi:glycosyltransferase involved in cell wall biosynthesis